MTSTPYFQADPFLTDLQSKLSDEERRQHGNRVSHLSGPEFVREIERVEGMIQSRPNPVYHNKESKMTEPILQFFAYEHLPEHLKAVSRPFGELAAWIDVALPRNPERTVALRKLLEAKDAAVRARLFQS